MQSLIAIAEGEEDWRAAEVVGFAEAAFEVALIAPVKEAELAAVDDKPRWTSVGLNHVAELWMGILEACWWMAGDSVLEELVKIGSL